MPIHYTQAENIMLFKDVLVDTNLKQQLIKQVQDHRVSHAQFFLAQSGSHAFALAIALAQYLNCEHPTDEDSCGLCPSCVQFSKLTHPDLHLYFPNCITKSVKKDPDSLQLLQPFREFVAQHDYFIDIQDWLLELGGENKQANINIRDCADIIHHNSIRSYSGGYKIYILWSIDRIHHSAAPKLLKTLEEPENRSLFILISEKPELILSTILSRTQLVKIPRLTNGQITSALRQRFPDMDEQTALDIAVLAEGDYNKALKIHEDDTALSANLSAFTTMMNGVIAFSKQMPLGSLQYESVQLEFSEIIAQGRENQKQFLEFTLRMLRNILMLNSKPPEMVKATASEREALEKLQSDMTLKRISLISDECNKALYHISRNGNSSLVFTDLFFKMAAAMR